MADSVTPEDGGTNPESVQLLARALGHDPATLTDDETGLVGRMARLFGPNLTVIDDGETTIIFSPDTEE
jgi:hypothetical protein